jgi:hypothetical protein
VKDTRFGDSPYDLITAAPAGQSREQFAAQKAVES